MSMTGGPDPTLPAGPGPGTPGGADPTMPVTSQVPGQGSGGYGGPAGPPGGGGYRGDGNGDESDNRRLWMIAGGVLIGGIIVGALVALLASGGDSGTSANTTTSSSSSTSTSTSTSSSSSTSTSSSTTSTTSAAPGPQITQFTASPSPVNCMGGGVINELLTWATQNANSVTISIDGPGAYGNYAATGNQTVPFSCGSPSHTYLLTANGQVNQKVQRQIVVQAAPNPTTTTSKP